MIYEPREDSYLMNNYIESLELQGKDLLEIGVGSGLISKTAKKKGANVTAADVNEETLNHLNNDINTVKSDIFENIEGKFDVIVFNPPYLPGKKEEAKMKGSETWYGGKTGIEVSERFLENCESYLKDNGEALILASSLSNYQEMMEKFDLDIVETKQLFFEKLLLLSYSLE